MFEDLIRRDFIKTAAVGVFAVNAFDVLGLFPEEKIFAAKRGYNTISMKNDWKTIYGDNVKREK